MFIKWLKIKRNIKGNQGFTLVEVLAAVTLMAVSLVLIAQLLNYSIKYNGESGNRTVANNLAQEKIEEYRNNYYITGEAIAVVPGFSKFKREVQLLPNTPTDKTNIVKVTVNWTANGGSLNKVELQTVIEK